MGLYTLGHLHTHTNSFHLPCGNVCTIFFFNNWQNTTGSDLVGGCRVCAPSPCDVVINLEFYGICLHHLSVTSFISGAPPKRNPGCTPVPTIISCELLLLRIQVMLM